MTGELALIAAFFLALIVVFWLLIIPELRTFWPEYGRMGNDT